MNIEELKQKKKKLSSDIAVLLRTFQDETGLLPKGIELTTGIIGFDQKDCVVKVDVLIEL